MTLIDLDAIQETLSEVAKKKHERLSVADEIIAMIEAQKAFYEEAVRVSSPPIKKSFIERSSAISSALEQAKAIKAKSEVSDETN